MSCRWEGEWPEDPASAGARRGVSGVALGRAGLPGRLVGLSARRVLCHVLLWDGPPMAP